MDFIKGIVILCLLFGSIDCQDPTSPKTSITTSETTITETTVGGDLTSDTTVLNSTHTSTNDIILTDGKITDIENETTTVGKENSTATEGNSTNSVTETTETLTSTVAPKPSPCSNNTCKNNGTCIEDLENPETYSCACVEGFIGTRCQVYDGCVSRNGTNSTLCLHGACVYESDELSRFCQCFTGKFWDDEAKECLESVPPCFPNPCLNNGVCVRKDHSNFTCDCPSGYEGKTCNIVNECGEDLCPFGECVTKDNLKYCECNKNFYWNETVKACKAIKPCHPNPCQNDGICKPETTGDGFNCTCKSNHIGKTCEFQDFCVPLDGAVEECTNGECVDSNGSRICHCNKRYFLNEDNLCQAIDLPCHPNPCKNHGICVPVGSNSYNCTCSEGFVGKTCEERDYCTLSGGNAFCRGASCANDRNMETFYCSCESGHYFNYVSRRCDKTDFCPLMHCKDSEICENSQCSCEENYEWSNSTKKCEPNFCPFHPCPAKDLICLQGNGIVDYECSCKKGQYFNGTHCKDGSSCKFPNLNSCEQICVNDNGNYSCECSDDFQLKEDKTTCEHIGNSTCSNKTCSLGSCVAVGTIEKCICPPGFIEKEGTCRDLCSAGSLPKGLCPDNKCESTSSGFRCKCEGKYKYSSDQTTCTVRRICQRSEEGWKTCTAHNAICIEEWSNDAGYRCECGSGFVKDQDGTCQDICSIEENKKSCSMFGAKCDIDSTGNKTCKCPPYFQPFEEGQRCNKPALFSYIWTLPLNPVIYETETSNPVQMGRQANVEYTVDYKKSKEDIQNAIEKVIPGLLRINILSYVKSRNYILCKVEMQFSSVTAGDLKRLSSPNLCQTNAESPSSCMISPSLVLQRYYVKDLATVKKTDPCDSDLKDALCESETSCVSFTEESSFNCTCKPGFAVRNKIYPFGTTTSSIESCRDIDECSINNPCPENMKCRNLFGSYECSCKPGYRVDKESSGERCVELCNPNPCAHGICSELADHEFQCRCDAGFRGAMCDLHDENFKRARTNTIIVGAVLGGALLVTLILSYVFISRLKRRKYMDDPDHMLYATEMTERRNVDSGVINNAYQ